ncbi:MAG: UDP-2,3-diacylglucosamine diphosphatase [Hydrogenophaga sp.]
MTDTAVDRLIPWRAPAHWQAVDFISDLHLQAGEQATFERWADFMQRPIESHADALVILGDFFEVWPGDDLLLAGPKTPGAAFARRCAAILQTHSAQRPVYFMHGNRDFLLGPAAEKMAGMLPLIDPTLLEIFGRRYLLSHGDALCLADTDYLVFRKQVRSNAWQVDFLAQPLSQRLAITRDLRAQSEAKKMEAGTDPALWADVDADAARHWLTQSQAQILIHGHTHRAREHGLGDGMRRIVLSDWDAQAPSPRAEVLRLDAQGLHRMRV